MSETMDVLLNRSSVRNFTDERIDPVLLDQILNIAIHSASGGNLQPISIIKIESRETKQWLTDLGLQKFIAKAPVDLLFCLDFHRLKRWAKLEGAPFVMDESIRHFFIGFEDTIIAAQTVETAVNACGLGCVYIGGVIDMIDLLKERLDLPQGVIPLVMLAIGHPGENKKAAPKLALETIVHEETYHDPDDACLMKAFKNKFGEPSLEINNDRLERILKVVEETDGLDRVNEVREYFEIHDTIPKSMQYFCMIYMANLMASDNTRTMDILEKDGFLWAGRKNHPECVEFKEYE